ncbi:MULTISPECIES: sugar phosphate isomerase/epimerase family protein [Cytobacillus]|uniref:sugar phosphate isomerase/epimerase family protein n=1 Tax=Cytobacillus TaxID=2675230 RepID=UPI00203F14B6|nr:sugar phosphate isomerase/epimerase family protein [Cytobacillus oceanisediminis]MCM3243222.1 sugar phosphate isomerase/epimerase [Cytobacillus oceanisediminis]MDK7665467.1 sugar phosphate isomerase/epimerase family protein [Cytobacillus oceanisediminis]
MENYERLSLNQITTEQWNLREAIEGCARAEVPWIAPWRHKVKELGLSTSKRLIKDAGLKVSSLCRGGMFPAGSAAERQKRIDDNKRAVEEAAELGTDVLVLVCGPSPDRDIVSARQMVEEGIAQLVPFAESHGVKLGIEPLHPMYAAERSVVVSMDLANTLAEAYRPDQVGVVVDVFHIWWDPDLYNQISRAKGRILGFHVSDWLVPTPDMLKGRGMMGDGVIEISRIRKAVEKTGYSGPIEVEIFNDQIWSQPAEDTLIQMKESYLKHV